VVSGSCVYHHVAEMAYVFTAVEQKPLMITNDLLRLFVSSLIAGS
jgi:hypothetical protein